MRALLVCLSVAAAVAVAAVPASAQTPMRAGNEHVLRIDSSGPSDVEAVDTGRGKRFTIEHPAATYIAIHFERFDLAPGDFAIVSDAAGGQSYTLRGRGKMEAGSFWSQHVKGDTAVVELVTRGERLGRGFVIDAYAAGFVDLGATEGVEAICGSSQLQNAVCYQTSNPTEYGRARAVARLLIQGTTLCTGWLASASSHLVTNEHCISSASAALNTDYEFMSEAPSCSTGNCQLCHPGVIYSGATFVQDNISLDYALVQLAGDPAASYGFLEIDNRDAIVGEQIYIPQHPGGRAKELGIADTSASGGVCRVSTITTPSCTNVPTYSDVGYSCDTEGGSSGSPVLATSSHKVIALHHCALCPNRAVPIDLVCAEICGITGGGGPQCESGADCADGQACTTDACNAGVCSHTAVTACASGDGCCAPGCTFGNDADCPSCLARGATCTANSQCCSNSCKGGSSRKTCR